MIHLHLQKIMDDKNLTPHDIAPYMNLSERSIYRTIRAERCPTLVDLVMFAAVLDVPINDLYSIDGPGTNCDPEGLIKLQNLANSGKNAGKILQIKRQVLKYNCQRDARTPLSIRMRHKIKWRESV